MTSSSNRDKFGILLVVVALGAALAWGYSLIIGDELGELDENSSVTTDEEKARRNSPKKANSTAVATIKGIVRSPHVERAKLHVKFSPAPGARSEQNLPLPLTLALESQGAFSFDVRRYCVCHLAIQSAATSTFQTSILVTPGQRVDLGEIKLENGATLRGVIVNESGDAIAGAKVSAGPRGWVASKDGAGGILVGLDLEKVQQTSSNASGEFLLLGVTPGQIAAIVECPGYRPTCLMNLSLKASEEESVEIELESARELVIRVVDQKSQEAIDDFDVELTALDFALGDQVMQAFNHRTIRSQGQSAITVKDLASRRYRLRVRAPGFLDTPDVIVGKEQVEVKVPIQRCPVVMGHVIDADSNKPVSKFSLTTSHVSQRARGQGFRVLKSEETARRFQVPQDAGLFSLVEGSQRGVVINVEAPGYASGRFEVEDLEGGEIARIRCPLRRGFELSGLVRSFDYKNLPGATVTATYLGGDEVNGDAAERALMTGDLSTVDPANGHLVFSPRATRSVTTNDTGQFKLVGLFPGKYRLVASHPTQQDSVGLEFTVGKGEPAVGVELQTSPAGAVTGRVSDSTGRFVAGASVSLRTPMPPGAKGALASLALTEEITSVFANESGEFIITGIKPGSYSLLAHRPELERGQKGSKEAVQVQIQIRAGGKLVQPLALVGDQ